MGSKAGAAAETPAAAVGRTAAPQAQLRACPQGTATPFAPAGRKRAPHGEVTFSACGDLHTPPHSGGGNASYRFA
ncbi:MAG: hypothetical protein IJN00_01125 [Clostridia bacterium]|nr:hypothetical protein [Clostridia bacterium]